MTKLSIDALSRLKDEALAALTVIDNPDKLEAWRVTYMGRKGQATMLLKSLKELPEDQRREIGQVANRLRQELQQGYQEKVAQLPQAAKTEKSQEEQPVTYLAGLPEPGHLHPLTLVIRKIQTIFTELGFTLVEGPEVDEPKYNFDLLNIPPQHPARSDMDTFYLTGGQLLRTQVSTMQIRGVQDYGIRPPYQYYYFGRTFRAERTDATHETTFHQFEFMVVNETASLAELKGIVELFYSRFFGEAAEIRFRPGFFPFVEPGLEVDLRCIFCKGSGCRICKQSGWIEMAGAGMVHPQVLRNNNIDPEVYQGFALGGAVDRLAMLLYGIDDIRLFWSGDLRFLNQFS